MGDGVPPKIVPAMFRMSAFLPMNTPIVVGMLLSPPTMKHTIFWQWYNQSYMAGLNYSNKNPQSVFSNEDLMKGYMASVSASLFVALSMRKMFSSMSGSLQGSRLLIANTLVAALSCSCASYVNTTLMR